MSEIKLLPCPFCGGSADFFRRGDKRQSCVVVCEDCGVKHESPDEGERCGSSWNHRNHAAVIARLEGVPATDIAEAWWSGFGITEACEAVRARLIQEAKK